MQLKNKHHDELDEFVLNTSFVVLLLNDCSVLSKSVHFSEPQFPQWRQEFLCHGITRRPQLKQK